MKKKKLTVTVSSKKPYNVPNYTRSNQKKSVVIEKKFSRKKREKRFFGRENNTTKSISGFLDKTKSKKTENFASKNIEKNRNFEIRKIAEERATKRFRN